MDEMIKHKKELIKKKIKCHTIIFEDDKVKDKEIFVLSFKNEDLPDLNLPSNKDLVPGSYEGGIKIWECSLDLCNFLPKYIGYYPMEKLNVLELGCGHGLPGLYFLLRGCRVMFQDFNKEVLEKITYSYIKQLSDNYKLGKINFYKYYLLDFSENLSFMDGDWSKLTENLKSG
jgi:hypothetical protein